MNHVLRRATVPLLALAASLRLHAAEPSNPLDDGARELQRQQQRERDRADRLQPAPEVRLPRPAEVEPATRGDPSSTSCFPIRSISLSGLSGADSGTFTFALRAIADLERWLVEPRCLDAAGINAVLASVQNAILERGYVTTRVLAGPQELKTGVLQLTVVAGRVQSIRMDAPDPDVDQGQHGAHHAQDAASLDDASASGHWSPVRNALPISPGQMLDLRDIEQGLENLKRLPTVDADIRIAPTDELGQSDLVVTRTQASKLRTSLGIDDSGSKATGRYQGNATLAVDNLLAINDIGYVTLSHDLAGNGSHGKGTRGTTLHYSAPFGYWLLGVTGSSFDYRQAVAGFSQSYLYSGESSNADIRLSRVLYRDASIKTSAWVSGWTRSSRNFIDDTEIEVQHRRTAGVEYGLSHRQFVARSTTDFGLSWRQGTGAAHALAAPEEAFGEGASRVRLIKADAAATVPFSVGGERLRYTLASRAQWSDTPLVAQDRFSIGNRYTVRGFDGELTLAGERGLLVRNEFAWSVPGIAGELYLGADVGRVSGPSAAALLGRSLAGAVVGTRMTHKALSADVFVSTPLHKPDHFHTAGVTAGFNLNLSF